jgi:hypothetical protein
VKTGGEVRQGCCLSRSLFKLYREYLTTGVVERFGNFRVGGHLIRISKYADELVLMTVEETVLQGKFARLIEVGSSYGIEVVAEKVKVYAALVLVPSYSLERVDINPNYVNRW